MRIIIFLSVDFHVHISNVVVTFGIRCWSQDMDHNFFLFNLKQTEACSEVIIIPSASQFD